jgi:hypothetical protein
MQASTIITALSNVLIHFLLLQNYNLGALVASSELVEQITFFTATRVVSFYKFH